MKNRLIISIFYLVGLMFVSFGVSMMILARLGAGPWDALFVALSENLGLTVGSWTFIVGFFLILLNGLLMKKMPDFSALITMFIIGLFIDFWLVFVFADLVMMQLTLRAGMLITGILSIAVGVSMYLQSNFARNPIDNLMMAFHYLTGKSLSFSKTFLEVLVLVIAFIIGGPIGVGTILVAFGIGPLIQVFFKPVTKLRNYFTGGLSPQLFS
ncbi:membrane protein [Salipaludibacillus neizhouensis]|uniref:Membrane protein n=1 Tax=Salipaludibacillus neizhouensis TaxID=885475 RepID=A0A3A9KP09_9BACI|nr:membrane protein [Salipaludibacillus neizhouensis]RKL66446.1 membrane protein [Salipaludibacillus neizhouensis]